MMSAASRVVTMLPSTPQVQAVYLDPSSGILAGLPHLPPHTPPLVVEPTSTAPETWEGHTPSSSTTPTSANAPISSPDPVPPPDTGSSSQGVHTLLIDQTTLDPTVARELAARVHAESEGRVAMVDAPVSGGKSCCCLTVSAG